MENCTILVNSCDAYSDVWFVFFELFRIHWSDCPYPVVLNTESKSYGHPNMPNDRIQSFHIYPQPDAAPEWTTRLIENIKRIDTEYILMFLDDDLIIDEVDTDRVKQCIRWMDENPEVMCFRAMETQESKNCIPSEKYPGFNYDTPDSFRSTLNIMLCRKSGLLKNILPGENPWECEGNGILRTKFWEGEYYSSQVGKPLIPYNANKFGGYGIWHGKWLENTVGLCREHGIEYDFNKRGILTEKDVHEIREKEIEEARRSESSKSIKAVLSRFHQKLYYAKKSIQNRIWMMRNK
ncbi:hypothetical protein [Ruminococcus sp.]|uniref:hypothetical protein n=1 Tax=Ruminococcus sp. TaxID=41978 RepID=UPI00388EADA5